MTSGGTRRKTGEADLIVLQYSYGDSGMGRIGNQIEVSAYGGWGDALKASVKGSSEKGGSCKVNGSTFPSKKLLPLNSWRLGESFFDTTIRNPGSQGKCMTKWNLTLTNPTYSSAAAPYSFNDFRCDNNTAGRPGVGCVVPWYASVLWYSKSRYPQLASHVTRAQASGLPGATFAKPLTRTTSATTVRDNRRLACGDAPSVRQKSCDEYPIAQSQQGLSSGGARRSFTGCNFNRVPAGTGPRGASACMIKATENNAQGGLNTQFFRSQRVLNGDPFQIRIN